MIKAFFHEMLAIVFAHNFNLASKFIIGTFDKLKLTYFPVLLDMLSQRPLATFVVAFNNLEQTTFIVGGNVLMDDDGLAPVVLTHDSSEHTSCFVLLKLLSAQNYVASFFENALTLVRACNRLHQALNLDVVFHLTPKYSFTTSVSALKFSVYAGVSDVVIHEVQWHFLPTI